jgi:hypothetical protein
MRCSYVGQYYLSSICMIRPKAIANWAMGQTFGYFVSL